MGQPLAVTVQLTEISCGECGGTYAINERYREQKHTAGGFWTCPYCKCGWGYGTSQIDKVKKQLQEEQERHQRTLTRLNATERAEHKVKRELKRVNTRVSAGVCPCCNRTFQQLARHMKCKHPDYE